MVIPPADCISFPIPVNGNRVMVSGVGDELGLGAGLGLPPGPSGFEPGLPLGRGGLAMRTGWHSGSGRPGAR